MRIDMRKIGNIQEGDEIIGSRHRAKVVKNKVAAPFKQAEFDLLYNKGISQEGEILSLGEKFEILQKSGSAYAYGDVKVGRGYDSACAFLAEKENKAVRGEILKAIRIKLKEEATL